MHTKSTTKTYFYYKCLMWKYVFIIDFVCENIFSFFIVDFGHSYVMEMSFRAKDNFEKKKSFGRDH